MSDDWRPVADAPTDDTWIVVIAPNMMPIVTLGDVLKAARLANTPKHLSMQWVTHFMKLPTFGHESTGALS